MSKYIAIDIGHGTNTSGKGVQKGKVFYKEHTFNSAVGLQLDKLLKHNGFRTLMYQKPNSTEVSLNTRINYYNKQKVDMVVSIHADANSNKQAKGRYAFYWHTSSKAKKLAQLYANEVKALGYSLRGNGTQDSKPNSWTNLAITRDNKAVAILTENGFMTNDADFELIFNSEKYIQDIALAHAKAICQYFGVAFKNLNESNAAVKTTTTTKSVTPTTKTHKVVKGDTLSAIAKKYGLTLAKLRSLNPSVKGDLIKVGQVLTVGATTTATTTTTKTSTNQSVTTKAVTPLANSSAVRPYPGKPLTVGTRGRDVEALQRALGFKGSAIDGNFGVNTKNAVINYQKRHNLNPTGVVDLATWNTIF